MAFIGTIIGVYIYRNAGPALGLMLCAMSACVSYFILLSIYITFSDVSYSCLVVNYKLSLAQPPKIDVRINTAGDWAHDSYRVGQDAYRVGWPSYEQ